MAVGVGVGGSGARGGEGGARGGREVVGGDFSWGMGRRTLGGAV